MVGLDKIKGKNSFGLPKNITFVKNRKSRKYKVDIFSKEEGSKYHVGYFEELDEAIRERDKWLVENYDKVKGYLPRGISKKNSKYRAYVTLPNKRNGESRQVQIGEFDTIGEAVRERTRFIMSLL